MLFAVYKKLKWIYVYVYYYGTEQHIIAFFNTDTEIW